jgi:hypothetical protein
MAHLDTVVQVVPIDGESRGFDRPTGALLRSSRAKPGKPRDAIERYLNDTAIGKGDDEVVASKCDAVCPDLVSGPSG